MLVRVEGELPARLSPLAARPAPAPDAGRARRRGSARAAAPGSGIVVFAARGPPAPASKSVNQTEPVGSSPGGLCTVYRIHTPSGSDGWQALR